MSTTPERDASEREALARVLFGFHMENRGGVLVRVDVDGGCAPATQAERALWAYFAARPAPVVSAEAVAWGTQEGTAIEVYRSDAEARADVRRYPSILTLVKVITVADTPAAADEATP